MEEEMESQVEEDFSQEESYEEPAAIEETSVAVEEQVSEPEGKESWDFSDAYDVHIPDEGDNPFYQQVNELGFDVQDNRSAQETLLNQYNEAFEYNQKWQNWYETQEQEKQQQQQQYAQQQQQMQQQMQQMQQMAEAGQVFQQMSQDPKFVDWAYQTYGNGEQSPRAQEEAQDDNWWTPPKLDQEEIKRWRVQKQDPSNGRWYWDWKDNTPGELKDTAERYVEYHDKWKDDILQKPQEVLPQVIEKEFDRLFVDRYGALMNQYQQQAEQQGKMQNAANINQRNADWVYQRNPDTGEFYRDGTGQLILTREGEQVIGHIHSLRQQGINDPEQLWQLSSQLLAGDLAQRRLQTQTQQMQATQQNYERQMQHLRRGAGHISNREGSRAPVENPSPRSQNQNLTAGDKLRQQALSDGLF